jgi:hypothetical protein
MPNIAAHAPQSYNFHIFLTVLGQMLGQPSCASPVYVPDGMRPGIFVLALSLS